MSGLKIGDLVMVVAGKSERHSGQCGEIERLGGDDIRWGPDWVLVDFVTGRRWLLVDAVTPMTPEVRATALAAELREREAMLGVEE
jgi:hypothetical protein